jgi:hypothetical protein
LDEDDKFEKGGDVISNISGTFYSNDYSEDFMRGGKYDSNKNLSKKKVTFD